MVKDYDGQIVETSKHTFATRNLIWAAGVKGDIPFGLGSLAESGRIRVDEFGFVPDHDGLLAIGDEALMKTNKFANGLPMLASVVQQQGAYLAKEIFRRVQGKKARPFEYRDKGIVATVGRNKAVVDIGRFHIGGFFAWLFVHLMLLVDFRNRLIDFSNWVWSYLNSDRGTRLIVRKFSKDVAEEEVTDKSIILP